MKCVEKYRVNKEGFSEMMSLLPLGPARDTGPICSPSGCSALGMASATRSRFDGEELVVIYQSSAKDKARRGGGQPGSAGMHWRQELASGTIPARLQDAERRSPIPSAH